MTAYLLVLVLIWAGSIGIWYLLSKSMRGAETERVLNRLMGRTNQAQSKRDPDRGPVLIAPEDRSTGKYVVKLLKKFQLMEKARELIEQSGKTWRPVRLVHACLGLFLIGFLVMRAALPGEWRLAAFLGGFAAGLAPVLGLQRLKKKRLEAFEGQFPDCLEFLARSMRAGHAFAVSIEMLSKEFKEPLSGEFRRVFEEHNLGQPLEVALVRLSRRIPVLDVQFFVSAVMLQRRTGGNLAEILDKLAYVIRERFKLRGKIRAVSAHGRMTGAALSCIPLVVAVLMFYTNPDYVRFFLTEDVGRMMLAAAVGLQLLGYAVIQRIVRIEV